MTTRPLPGTFSLLLCISVLSTAMTLSGCGNSDNSSPSVTKQEETSVTVGADGKTTVVEKESEKKADDDDSSNQATESKDNSVKVEAGGSDGDTRVKVNLPGIKVDIDESKGSVNVSTPYADIKKDPGKSKATVEINLDSSDAKGDSEK
ncbi:MAG TPA: hypothetical protein PKW73_10985 [Candidatus Obscuribacter sp.]|nr:hypothetical protein [Candidatus Obscuribacter sp.]